MRHPFLLGVGPVVIALGCGTSAGGPIESFGGQSLGTDDAGRVSGGNGAGSNNSSGGGAVGTALPPAADGANDNLLTGDASIDASAATATGDPTTCAEAAQSHTYVGCDYWPTVVGNQVWSIFDFAVVVANAGTTTAAVTVAGMAGTTSVPAGQLAKIYLPWVASLKGPDQDNCSAVAMPLTASVMAPGKAYHLTSTVPVTVYQFNALEYHGQGGPAGKSWASCPGDLVCADPNNVYNFGTTAGCYSFSNDASLLLPSTAMTGNYRVVGHEGWTLVDRAVQPAEMVSFDAYMAITGTQNATTVNVKVSTTGQIAAGNMGIAATAAGGMLTFTLNAGDVAELVGSGGGDLSGSIVQASAPVQVITGIPCADVPPLAPACDHMEESVFPAETLGKDYIVTRPAGPNGDVVPHQVRIFGNVDGTNLKYNPVAPPGCPATINAGQVVECGNPACPATVDVNLTTGMNCGTTNADFEVVGDQPFAVATFTLGATIVDPSPPKGSLSEGDPAQSMVPAIEQFRVKYVFLAPDDYPVSYVDVVAKPATTMTLDGQTVTAAPQAIGTSAYSVYRVKLGAGQPGGAHVLTSSLPVGIQVVGYGAFTSYMYPGGLNLDLIAPPPRIE
jgi:hypothetical protein